jgi:beta-alanine--pyruvate transaminase
VHSLKGLPNVLDIRSVGLSAAIDLAAKPGARGKRGFAAMDRAFRDFDLLLRAAGDTLILMPPLIISEAQIGEIVEKTAHAVKAAS